MNGGSVSGNAAVLLGGGAILSIGTLLLDGVALSGNSAPLGGGGIAVGVPPNAPTARGRAPLPASAALVDSTVSGNETAGDGGGVFVDGGELTATGSTFSGNSAGDGSGGAVFALDATVRLTNDTFSGNTAGLGGAIMQQQLAPHVPAQPTAALTGRVRGAQANAEALLGLVGQEKLPAPAAAAVHQEPARRAQKPADVALDFVTIAGNTASVSGGGVFNAQALTFDVRDTIVASNTAALAPNCWGTVASGGHNLESGTDCGFTAATDRQNAEPRLGPLAGNGGLTRTMALLPGSLALDAGDPACPPPATDQRGVRRPQGALCDIGAFEAVVGAGPLPVPLPPPTGQGGS
jgi:predicted outer membrane repeat protein